MTQQNETAFLTFTSGEALEIYRRVKLSGTNDRVVLYADAGEEAIGITQERVAITKKVAVRAITDTGTFKMTASAAMATRNALVYGTDDGKIAATGTGPSLGRTLDVASADGSIVEVAAAGQSGEVAADANYIWVSKNGNDTVGDGSRFRPVLTMTQALTLVTSSRNKIMVLPGEYEEATTLTWPAFNGSITGIGGDSWGHGVTILEPTDSATTFSLTIATGTRVFSMNQIAVECAEDTVGVYAVKLENTGDAKLYFTSHELTIEQGTLSTSASIGLYINSPATDKFEGQMTGGKINGYITAVWGNNNDRLRMNGVTFLDGMHTSGAFTGKVECAHCVGREGGNFLTLDHASNVGEVGTCVGYTAGEVFGQITGTAGAGAGSGVAGTTAF